MQYVLQNNSPTSRVEGSYLTWPHNDDGTWTDNSGQNRRNAFGYTRDIDLARKFNSVEDVVQYVSVCTRENARVGFNAITYGFSIVRVEEVAPRTQWRTIGKVQ